MGVELIEAFGRGVRFGPGRKAFLELPARVYRNDRHHCPTPKADLERRLDALSSRDEGAFAAWVAVESGCPVARVGAWLDSRARDPGGRRYGVLGWFESEPTPGAAHALLDRALEWLAHRGTEVVYGPIDGDTWHRYRFSLGPRERRPFLLEPHNPDHYPSLWQAHGFELAESYLSKRIEDPARVREHLAAGAQRARESGYRIVSFDHHQFDREIERILSLSRRIFDRNLLFTDISRAEFVALYHGMRPLIDPGLVVFAVSTGGEDVGFAFAYPDLFEAVIARRGKRGPLADVRFLLARRRRPEAVNVKSAGVLREHRRSGVAAALLCRVYDQIVELGYRATNHCLIRSGNPSDELDGGAGVVSRRYALFRRELAGQ